MLNLLPWRKLRLRKILFQLILLLVITVSITVCCVVVGRHVINSHTIRLHEESACLSGKIKQLLQDKEVLNKRWQKIETLLQDNEWRLRQQFILIVLKNMLEQLPENATLTSLLYTNFMFQIEGMVYGSSLESMRKFKEKLGAVLARSIKLDFELGQVMSKKMFKLQISMANK